MKSIFCLLPMKKESKHREFTLAELVDVLVILALLATRLIPQLATYIEKANNLGLIAQCRSCVIAAQTISDERYGKGQTPAVSVLDKAEIFELAHVNADGMLLSLDVKPNSTAIAELTYCAKNDTKTAVYRNGTFSILPISQFGSQALAKAAELMFANSQYCGGSSNNRMNAVLDLYKLMGMTEFQKVDTALVQKVYGRVPAGYDAKRWVAYPLGKANGNPLSGDVVYYANSGVTTTDAYTGLGDQSYYNMIYINGILYYNPNPNASQRTMQYNVATGAELAATIKAKGWVAYTG